ncbi:hypothetical protein CN177_18310 [Sinorhizobium meliloti]|nr:hypothetical protein CN219_14875 [Sinorhizobium meliloti]RVI37103.1 hypothetical protein CN197_09995 [Sinorhizobium meliloti]RVI43003.1 hypothetical protein CN196_20295 [Sinorhizobium meliloti]RVJ23223.1 hypothetical protein CN177_18310 [Sinorhizobium meliloti]RVK01347.1 hypothetical protein CN170_11005 [Sinorhizobium meliloti]
METGKPQVSRFGLDNRREVHMSKVLAAAVIVVLVVIAALWMMFPLDQSAESGQPPPHAIDQSE